MNTGPHSKYSVDKLAWSLAAISLLAAAGFIYLLVTIASSSYRALYARQVEEGIESKNYQGAGSSIEKLFRGPPVIGQIRIKDDSESATEREIASNLVETFNSLTPARLPLAQQKIASIKARASQKQDFPTAAVDELGKIEAELKNASKKEQQIEALFQEKSQINRDRTAALSQFDLLAKDTSELFSLPPRSSTSQGESPSFYSSGVLAGLPQLNGLPDSISSLEDLRAKLAAAGGSVRIQGENIPLLFEEKLHSLRSGGSNLQEILSSSGTRLSEATSSATKLNAELDRDISTATVELKTMLKKLMDDWS